MKRSALILLIALFMLSAAYAVLAQEAPLGGILPAATLVPPTKTATPTPSPVPTNVPAAPQSQSHNSGAAAQSVSVPNADATCHYDSVRGVWLVEICEVWPKGLNAESIYVPWKPGCTAPRLIQCR